MSKHFSKKDLKGARTLGANSIVRIPTPVLPQPKTGPQPLPNRFVRWLDRAIRGEAADLPKRRPGIDVLEPRLLLSADPLTAAFAFVGTSTLRVSEVEFDTPDVNDGDETEKELRLQLVYGEDNTVFAERRIVEIDGQNRLVTSLAGEGNVFLDVLAITGSIGNDNLIIDNSFFSLHDAALFNVDLGD